MLEACENFIESYYTFIGGCLCWSLTRRNQEKRVGAHSPIRWWSLASFHPGKPRTKQRLGAEGEHGVGFKWETLKQRFHSLARSLSVMKSDDFYLCVYFLRIWRRPMCGWSVGREHHCPPAWGWGILRSGSWLLEWSVIFSFFWFHLWMIRRSQNISRKTWRVKKGHILLHPYPDLTEHWPSSYLKT